MDRPRRCRQNRRHDQQRHSRPRRHRQDRPAGRRPAATARHAGARRLAVQRDPRSTGPTPPAGTRRCRASPRCTSCRRPCPARCTSSWRGPRPPACSAWSCSPGAAPTLWGDSTFGLDMRSAEDAVRGSALEWTVLRSSNFAQNFDEDLWHAPLLAGELALPAGAVREPFVDLEDVADVAAAVLDRARPARRTDLRAHRTACDHLRRGRRADLPGVRAAHHLQADLPRRVHRGAGRPGCGARTTPTTSPRCS